ncbi:MAG: hypothetical protein K8R58_14625 [Bacteroidales bacterium]|nr:hypothetical protein [Bacteroidales bacterium]
MDEKFRNILEKIREYAYEKQINDISVDKISKKLKIPKKTIFQYVTNESELVEKVLEFERECFKSIFVEYNFEGVNAIDILLTVSKEVALRFKDINPSVTFFLKENYPAIYQEHFDKRIEFIFGKIKINIQKGINQGMYREDLSIELIARLYISRLIDIHNPDFFPSHKFSFEMLFEVMFENFIHSIAKPEGIKYFKKKIKSVNFILNKSG